MFEFHRRQKPAPAALTLFPGAFNPPTRAHLAMASAALERSDEVVFVLPRVFPHKEYEGPDFRQRLQMLIAATGPHPAFSVASCDRGLFIDIVRAARAAGERQPRLFFLCGADAACRILEWDYGAEGAIAAQLEEISSTAIREEIARGDRWREWIPPEIAALVEKLYS